MNFTVSSCPVYVLVCACAYTCVYLCMYVSVKESEGNFGMRRNLCMLCRRASGYRSRIGTFYNLVTVHNIQEVPCKGKKDI